jgi:hypothetical protein
MFMKHEDVKEIISCLGGEKQVFHYFKDRYCLDSIDYAMVRQEKSAFKVSEIKSGKLGRFLSKPIIKDRLKYFGTGEIQQSELALLWPESRESFVLGLDCWGKAERGWDQTTRNQCNLVLQLNFSQQHIKEYLRLVKPNDSYGPFEYRGHPISRRDRKTMSWVRMDIDFDTNEVLIEEIQNDWLRNARRVLNRLRKRREKAPQTKPNQVNRFIDANYEELEQYVENVLTPYDKIWAEASMTAAINFIRKDLGINNIYYHSFETGIQIKQVCGKPPRSMYTKLPKQFGFELGSEAPKFIAEDKNSKRYLRAIKDPMFYRLAS